jgi:hypothetical protein
LAPGPVSTGAVNITPLPPTGIRSPDHPARSESLYLLRYPDTQLTIEVLQASHRISVTCTHSGFSEGNGDVIDLVASELLFGIGLVIPTGTDARHKPLLQSMNPTKFHHNIHRTGLRNPVSCLLCRSSDCT